MVSVENLYHVLYEHLLKPVNFRMRYFWPFGTTDNLMYDLNPRIDGYRTGRSGSLVLFHHDQEPIYEESLSIIEDAAWVARPHRNPRVLANSEKSQIKRQICQKLGFFDWYFFYHGFAALDWYRDANYLDPDDYISHAFISLNHLSRDLRSYRISLMARMIEYEILHKGLVSFHGTSQDIRDELQSSRSYLSDHSKKLIERHMTCTLPLIIDKQYITGATSADFGFQSYHMRCKALFHVVNETVFYHDKLHLTEKVFQPIVCGRPFILAAAPGNLDYLKSYGFQTFDNWIDESYDNERDPDRRMDLIVDQLHSLCALPLKNLRSMLTDMKPVLEHNKKHFFGHFRRMVVNECVENFQQCLRIWNNGRVDDRVMPLHPDLDFVKQLLLR